MSLFVCEYLSSEKTKPIISVTVHPASSIMPVHRSSRPIASTSHARKSMGFSINDIIKNDESVAMLKTSPRHHPSPIMPTYLPQTAWLPPPPPTSSMDPLLQYQLQYLRHSGRLFDGRFASKWHVLSVSLANLDGVRRRSRSDCCSDSAFLSQAETCSNCFHTGSIIETWKCLREKSLCRRTRTQRISSTFEFNWNSSKSANQ